MNNSASSFARRALRLTAFALGMVVSAAVCRGSRELHRSQSRFDPAGGADHTEINLTNSWGLIFGPTTPVWVSDDTTGMSTVYDGDGNPILVGSPLRPLVVTSPGGAPTGITLTRPLPTSNRVSRRHCRVRCAFLWAAENGVIAAWKGSCGSSAVTIPSPATTDGVYKGVAIAGDGSTDSLVCRRCLNGKIQVFDHNFMPTSVPGGFVDPKLPQGYAPFNILSLQGHVYVSFDFHVAGDHDETAGPGLGIVDGVRRRRFPDRTRRDRR